MEQEIHLENGENVDNENVIDDITIITDYKDFDLTNLEFEDPVLENQVYYCKIKKPILIQTPFVDVMKSFYECKNKLLMNISLRNKEFSDLILEIDKRIISIIQLQFMKWFQKRITFESILETFLPTKLYTTDIESFMILTVPTLENDKINIDIYDKNGNLIENTQEFKRCCCIIECNGIYLEKNKFYLNWKLVQLKI